MAPGVVAQRRAKASGGFDGVIGYQELEIKNDTEGKTRRSMVERHVRDHRRSADPVTILLVRCLARSAVGAVGVFVLKRADLGRRRGNAQRVARLMEALLVMGLFNRYRVATPLVALWTATSRLGAAGEHVRRPASRRAITVTSHETAAR